MSALALKAIDPAHFDDAEYQSPEGAQLRDMYTKFYESVGYNPPWTGYLILEDGKLVGTCGFAGPPESNAVEVAYWTFSQYEGQGIASWACDQLISLTRNHDPKLEIIAKTAPEDNASTTILKKLGFVYSHVVSDHEIGDAWLWKLLVSPGIKPT